MKNKMKSLSASKLELVVPREAENFIASQVTWLTPESPMALRPNLAAGLPFSELFANSYISITI